MVNYKEHYNSILFKLPFFLHNTVAITLGYHVFFKDSKEDTGQRLKNHEYCHICQIKKEGIFYFYFSYLAQFLIHLVIEKNLYNAYIKISFEEEAYRLEHLSKEEIEQEILNV